MQGILVLTGSGAFFDNLVDEFFILSCQLRGNRFPDHRDLWKLADIGVFGKVTFVCADDVGQRFLHGGNITGFRPHENGFGHTTGDIVHLQLLAQRIEESIGDRLKVIPALQEGQQIIITISQQEFLESHGIDLHEGDLTHRERGRLCQSNTKERTGAGNVILWSVLAEILHGVNDLWAILHLVKNNERLFRHNLLAAGQHQVLQDAVNVLGGLEELLVFLVFIKVEISGIFIVTLAELFQNPGFTHLTHTFQNQRFTVGRILPVQQLF